MTNRTRPAAPKPSYGEAVRDFRWADSMRALGWTSAGDVSLGETLVDRHATSSRPALSWLGVDGSHRTYTFGELGRLSNRFANLLQALGVDRGDRVAGYLPRVPETLLILLGAWQG